MRIVPLFLTIFLLSFACGNSTSKNTIDAETANEDASRNQPLQASSYCESISDFFCDFYLRCDRMAVDTKADCEESFLESCNASFEGGFVGLATTGYLELSSKGIETCKKHLATVSCEQQFFELSGPCADMWVGHQSRGEPCGLDIEFYTCEPNSECVYGLDFCGICTALVDISESCEYGENTCGAQGFCKDSVCTARIPFGESCTEEDRCMGGSSCQDGVCIGARIVALGDVCDRSLRCPYMTACIDATCQSAVRIGESCGPSKPCASGYCEGTCLLPKADHQSCKASAQCRSSLCMEGKCSPRPSACISNPS